LGRRELTSEGRLLVGVLVAFVMIALLAALDLASDLREGTTVGHVVAEGGVFLVGMLGAVFMARRLTGVLRSERAGAKESAKDIRSSKTSKPALKAPAARFWIAPWAEQNAKPAGVKGDAA
jgi:hypothetical protein